MDYTQLQVDVADWLNRDDLAPSIPSFIRLAEANLSKRVRHWRMERRADAELDARFSALPADWQETISLELAGPVRHVELASRAEIAAERQRSGGQLGTPRLYAHTGGALELWPAPDRVYGSELVYYARLPALSATNPTTWLLTEAPGAYLYGALIASAPYLKDDPRIATWRDLYEEAIGTVTEDSERAKHGSSAPLRIRFKGGA